MPAAGLQILVTELGDETFIIAAIMAMRHPRLVVYVGAMTALVSMTVSWNNSACGNVTSSMQCTVFTRCPSQTWLKMSSPLQQNHYAWLSLTQG